MLIMCGCPSFHPTRCTLHACYFSPSCVHAAMHSQAHSNSFSLGKLWHVRAALINGVAQEVVPLCCSAFETSYRFVLACSLTNPVGPQDETERFAERNEERDVEGEHMSGQSGSGSRSAALPAPQLLRRTGSGHRRSASACHDLIRRLR